MKIKILCTLGPASFDPEVIEGLDRLAVDMYRINLSHTAAEDVAGAIELVRRHSATPICLDCEGPQVRCGPVDHEIVLREGQHVRLTGEQTMGTEHRLTLWPRSVFEVLRAGSVVSIDFDGALLQVIDVDRDEADALVVRSGQVRSNKAVTVDPAADLPALSQKDMDAIEIGIGYGIRHFALSFASSAEDVARLRALAPTDAHIIAKIESRAGVRQMDPIIEAADSVLIDRGDLSREIPLEHVPYYQKAIIRRANRWNRPVYVATNLLESMVTNRIPTIAESNDIANTLLDGVHGLVLAAETAVGTDPVGAVKMVIRAVRAFERASDSQLLDEDRVQLSAIAGADQVVGSF
jgi:pyruvate kinase